ncbi:MAG: PAS domain S-box protein [Deltaproteobacteria bacterium]|nr:PAS domain S-box protein [Deltaproteobacteria bacterium]
MKILIVDDNSTNLYMLESLLKGHGYEVISAMNGQEALDRARLDPPDLVVADIFMPVMDGFTLCREWKSDAALNHIPLVFYTGTYNEKKDEEFAISLGADRFIIKPQEPDVLLNMLQEVLDGNYVAKQVESKPLGEEMEFFRKHNEVLFKKLESKMMSLETVNQKLKALEEMYRLAFENVSDVIFTIDNNLKIISMTPSVEKILGYKPEDFIDKSASELRHVLSPDSLVQAEFSINMLLNGESVPPGVYELVTKDGTRKFCEVSSSSLTRDGEIIGLVSVARDITKRRQAEEFLRESNERFRALFERSLECVYIHDLRGNFIDVNQPTSNMTGYSRDEMLRLNFASLVDSEQLKTASRTLKSIVQNGAQSGVVEFRITRKDGGYRYVETSGSLVYRDGKPYAVLGVGRDITEQKQAEEMIIQSLREKESLLQEVHHRVKNNMQIISSMLSLQSDTAPQEEVASILRDSEGRVRSMALIHEKLYLSPDLSSINFAEYVESLVSHLFVAHNVYSDIISFVPQVEDIPLAIETAIPCGLIVNELVTNTLKYAFPQGRKGEVIVALHRNSDQTLTLSVSDTGIGLPEDIDPRSTGTFGMQLVSILTDQLSGTLEIERTEGTTFRITFSELQYKKRI